MQFKKGWLLKHESGIQLNLDISNSKKIQNELKKTNNSIYEMQSTQQQKIEGGVAFSYVSNNSNRPG